MSIMKDDRPQLNNLREVSQQYIDAKNRGERGLVLPREGNLPVKKYAGVQTVESIDNICVFTKQIGSDTVDIREKPSKNESHPVPAKIAYDMVEMIPDEVLLRPNLRVLDLSCNSGDCLQHIIYKLVDLYMNKYKKEYHFVSGTLKHMLKYTFDNVIYAVCPSEKALEYTKIGLTRRLAETGVNDSIELRNVYSWHELAKIIHEEHDKAVDWHYMGSEWADIIKCEGSRDLVIKEIFGDMKFDVVIGNPPYNNDMYIDFVQKGFELLKSDGVEIMITPAKWQAKGGAKNEAFRRDIVPHMKEITYYSDSREIFDIALSGGISVYIITDEVHVDKIVNGKIIKNFDINVPLDITAVETNIINRISKEAKMGDRPKFNECKGYFISILPTVIEQGTGTDNIDNSSDIYLTDCTGRKIPINKNRIKNIDDAYKYKLGISLHTFENGAYTSHIWEPNYIVGRNELILYVGTKEECEYANSFFGSKLVYWLCKRFFGSQTASALSFRFVPDPGAFDHIFTDEELYKKYGLTQEEINIIESVIKERK